MELSQAIELIRPGIRQEARVWADIGAGTGVFTAALAELIKGMGQGRTGVEGRIYAIDKSPHALWSLAGTMPVPVEVIEADFHQPLDIPQVDGILMANALHYANDHLTVLRQTLKSLKPGGSFILVEYDTDIPNVPWVPNPISLKVLRTLYAQTSLTEPEVIGSIPSKYRDYHIYCASSTKFINAPEN